MRAASSILLVAVVLVGCRRGDDTGYVLTRVQRDCILIKTSQATRSGRAKRLGREATRRWAQRACGVPEAVRPPYRVRFSGVDNARAPQSSRPVPPGAR